MMACAKITTTVAPVWERGREGRGGKGREVGHKLYYKEKACEFHVIAGLMSKCESGGGGGGGVRGGERSRL